MPAGVKHQDTYRKRSVVLNRSVGCHEALLRAPPDAALSRTLTQQLESTRTTSTSISAVTCRCSTAIFGLRSSLGVNVGWWAAHVAEYDDWPLPTARHTIRRSQYPTNLQIMCVWTGRAWIATLAGRFAESPRTRLISSRQCAIKCNTAQA